MNLHLKCSCVIARPPKEGNIAAFAEYRRTYLPTMLRNEFIYTEVSLVFLKPVEIHAIA